jgi:hypothetical protein
MRKLKSTRNKLLKSGFILDESDSDERTELWLGANGGRSIRLYKEGETVSSLRVYGEEPDQPQYDEVHSFYTPSVSAAIRVASSRRGR